MVEYTLAELGQWVHLLVKRAGRQDLIDAQVCLSKMQDRVKEVASMPGILETKPGWEEEPNEILEQLPMVETQEPKLVVAREFRPEGPPRDEGGKITRISSQPGDIGYDPEIGQREGLAIFCDGTHIETAHTADTKEGLVKYYKKDDKGRIKTLVLYGKIEIRGL